MDKRTMRVNATLAWLGVNWIAVMALLVSIVSAGFTYLQMRDAQTATALGIKPSVDFYTGDDDDMPIVGIQLMNEGPGVARIKGLTYYVDHKPVGDQDAAAKLFNAASDKILYNSFDDGDSLAVNDKPWLFYMKRREVTKRQFENFIDFIDNRVAINVEFCSEQGRCWTKCSTPHMC
ncbi:MAG: hypothetical protein WCA78_14695 [Rhizomicrobium sp.]